MYASSNHLLLFLAITSQHFGRKVREYFTYLPERNVTIKIMKFVKCNFLNRAVKNVKFHENWSTGCRDTRVQSCRSKCKLKPFSNYDTDDHVSNTKWYKNFKLYIFLSQICFLTKSFKTLNNSTKLLLSILSFSSLTGDNSSNKNTKREFITRILFHLLHTSKTSSHFFSSCSMSSHE